MTQPRQAQLKRLALIGCIICAAASHVWQPVPFRSQASISVERDLLQPAAMVDPPATGPIEQTLRTEDRSARPLFGMETEPEFAGLASKWREALLKIGREEKVLADCRHRQPCPEPALDLLKIIAAGEQRSGRARVGLVNRAVNLAIIARTDKVQWNVEDYWSSPLETMGTRRGDCEDYAIVKYVALRELGLSSEDVKIVILRNLVPNDYHAVAAVRVDEEWLILDNRTLTLVSDSLIKAAPEFLLDENGMHRFVPARASLLSKS